MKQVCELSRFMSRVARRAADDDLWETLSPSAVDVEMEGIKVKVASYDDLVALKRQAARPSDLEDLERLRQARGE